MLQIALKKSLVHSNVLKVRTILSRSTLFGTKLSVNYSDQCSATTLPSLEESFDVHRQLHLKREENKYFRTKDEKTIRIVKDILSKRDSKLGSDIQNDFLQRVLMEQPNKTEQEECGSIVVKISDIDDFPEYKKIYRKMLNKNVLLCVGGPSAEDQALMAASIPQIKNSLHKIVYLTRDYLESNVNHSAKHSHARHANALNGDPTLTGHRLMFTFFKRFLFKEPLEKVAEPHYIKVDVKFDFWNFYKWKIYFGNEFNWLKQTIIHLTGKPTEHDMNRIDALISQDIMRHMQSLCDIKISGFKEQKKELVNIPGYPECSNIFVTFTKESDAEVEHENKEIIRANIPYRKLTDLEKKNFFPKGHNKILTAYSYKSDTHVYFDTHRINQKAAMEKGVDWLENEEVSNIFVTKDSKNSARLCGVLTKSGKFIYGSKLHITAGYKTKYIFDPLSRSRFLSNSSLRNTLNKAYDMFEVSNPLRNKQTISTGCSINAVLKKSPQLKDVIEKYGSTGEIALTNSHWTMIAESDTHILMRVTAGGNTGSENYKPSYFLNACENTKRIFGDDFIGVYSVYGCPRALNARNSTEYALIARDTIISYGKGGTGNTKRHLEAAKILIEMGYKDQIINYFNSIDKNERIGDKILDTVTNRNVFFFNNIKRTNKRMGFDTKTTLPEKFFLSGLCSSTAYYALISLL